MYIESVPNRNSPPAVLLRESFRDAGKVNKRTLANLSKWPPTLIEGLRVLLKGGAAVAPASTTPSTSSAPFLTAMSPPCSGRCVSWGSGRILTEIYAFTCRQPSLGY